MKIMAITDIHGRQNLNDKISRIIKKSDLVLIAGDITHFGGEKDAEIVLKTIQQLNENIIAVPGNCDRLSVNNVLTTWGINLHGKTKNLGKISIYGLGGCSKTPFHTPQEYTESEIAEILGGFEKNDAQYHILLSHSPPVKTKVDKVLVGLNVGSKAVRKFIEKFQPDIVICGHIHEARGTDKIGKSIIINPGIFPKHYALIDLADNIDYELH
jgi:putative phosphoesterase